MIDKLYSVVIRKIDNGYSVYLDKSGRFFDLFYCDYERDINRELYKRHGINRDGYTVLRIRLIRSAREAIQDQIKRIFDIDYISSDWKWCGKTLEHKSGRYICDLNQFDYKFR